MLVEASPTAASVTAYEVGDPTTPVPMEMIIDDLLKITSERNPDFYEFEDGKLRKVT